MSEPTIAPRRPSPPIPGGEGLFRAPPAELRRQHGNRPGQPPRPASGLAGHLHAAALQTHNLLEEFTVPLGVRGHAPLPGAQLGQAHKYNYVVMDDEYLNPTKYRPGPGGVAIYYRDNGRKPQCFG